MPIFQLIVSPVFVGGFYLADCTILIQEAYEIMIRIFIALLLTTLAIGCSDHVAPVSATKTDSSPARPEAAKVPADTMEDSPEPSLSGIYNECIARYDHPVDIDSIFRTGGDVLEVRLHHYCLKDSAIRLPKEYADMYKLDSFVTHNFETQLVVKRNDTVILDRVVRKKDFEGLLQYDNLRSYAVLLFPDVGMVRDTINVSYSITIPLTDVGIREILPLPLPQLLQQRPHVLRQRCFEEVLYPVGVFEF